MSNQTDLVSIYPTRREEGNNKFIEFSGLQYQYIHAMLLKSGEIKEYYKCAKCPARLQYFKSSASGIRLTSDHTLLECRLKISQWNKEMQKAMKKTLKSLDVIEEAMEDESSVDSPADLSVLELLSESIRSASVLDKTLYPDPPSEDSMENESDESEISVIIQDNDLDDTNLPNTNASPIRKSNLKAVYLPTPHPKVLRSRVIYTPEPNADQNNNKSKKGGTKGRSCIPSTSAANTPYVPPKKQVKFADVEESFVSKHSGK